MRRLIRMLTVNALMCLAVACSATAQTIPENPTNLPEQAKIVIAQAHVPVSLASESRAVRPEEVNEVNLQEVSPSVSLLSTLSDMLNEGAAKRAENNLETVRRNAMMNTEESIVSQYLTVNSAKQSV